MDLFDFFRDWELEQQCHYEQDRNALKRKEWERRNQEVQQDEDLFASGFNLFGEPYKTNKGDALANRLQNTLGNYDEMKDLLTNHSNQSHLVGIPKNSVPQTPVEKNEQNFFPEQRNRVVQCHQSSSSHCSSSMPPPSGLGPISTLGHEATRKSRTDWPPSGLNTTCAQSSQANSQPNRSKHNSLHDLSQIRYEDLYNCQNDQHKSVSIDEPVPATSSSHSRRHNHSKTLSSEHSYKESSHSKSPVDLEFSLHGSVSPLPSTSLLLAGNGLSSQNFPPGLHSKTNMLQQKPTAYVRPMDGQDQVPNDSPELKPPTEIEDGYNSQPFGAILDGKVNVPVSKNKLPKLSIPQTNEVGLPNDPSCVEEILREMTHLWPPPLTGIHTPCKAEQSKFPIPNKESQHLTSGYSIQKRCEVTNKPAVKSIPQKSMLEDDLKLSSDEEDSEQANEKAKQRSNPVNGLPLPTVHGANLVNSSGVSESSSESETSSESDSDSESSSSDSECNEENRNVTPEPEPPSTNKWQLDKWLNKVNPHNKTIINNQNDVHSDNNSEPQNNQLIEEGKRELSSVSSQSDSLPKDRELLSPVREKNKPRVPQKPPESKPLKQKSPAHNETTPQRAVAKKQPKKVERTSSAEDYSWNKPNPTSSTPKEKDVRESQEPPKARTKATVGKTAPRKEQRTCTSSASEKKKARGANKIVPKSREFIETDSASDSNTDQEEVLQVKLSKACTGPTNPVKSKDCSSNILSVSSLTSNSSSISLDQTHNDLEEPYSPLPVVQNELLSPLREFEEIKSLWVKIDLSLLSRIPGQETFEIEVLKNETRDQCFKHKPQTPAAATEKNPTKSRRKHKCENSDLQIDCKKQRLEETIAPCLLPPCISPIPSSRTSCTKDAKKTTKKREEKVFPPLLSPLGDEPVRRRHSSDNSSFSQDGSVTMIHVPVTSTRHKKNGSTITNNKVSCEEDNSRLPSSVLENIQHNSEPDLWSSVPAVTNGNADSRRSKITFDETLHNADYYMQEAKRLKHKADALIEKFGKAVNYADAALSFIECGNAMERDPLEAKSPYTMYSETVELIRYAMRLKNFTGSAANEGEKKLAVLCYRCLSLLYLRMFKLKKDHAMKYSRSLMEYFKSFLQISKKARKEGEFRKVNSSKSSQAPSPWGGNGKNTETPSPMSLSPSPASSAGNSSVVPGSSSTGTVSIPQRIHHMAASHVNITNNVLRSYEHWDMADKLTKENKEFFQDLNTVMEPLTQHSTMTDLVRYVRQGLHWLRVESQLL